MAATVAIFTEYPLDVVCVAVHSIVVRSDYPSLKLIKAVCDEVHAPTLRALQYEDRKLARERQPALLPRPPRTPEQQVAIDAQVADARRCHGIPAEGGARREVVLPPSADMPYSARVPLVLQDGGHAQRILADLEARRARNMVREVTTA